MTQQVEARLPGLVVTLLGVIFFVGGLSYGVTSNGRMGPGLMPTLAGLGLIVLGAVLVYRPGTDPAAQPTEVDVAVDPLDEATVASLDEATAAEVAALDENLVLAQEVHYPNRPWYILGTTVAALLVAPYIGLIPGLTLAAFVLLRFVERESWRMSLVVAVALAFFSWLVFEDLLEVNLPWGVFGGLL